MPDTLIPERKEMTSGALYDIIADKTKPYMSAYFGDGLGYEVFPYGDSQWVFRFLQPGPGMSARASLIALCPTPVDAVGFVAADWESLAYPEGKDGDRVDLMRPGSDD